MKKIIGIVLGIAILLPSISLANSMPTYYYGSGESVNDAILLNEECPIEVQNEVLTFDLQEFPKDYYEYSHEFNKYTGEVTAEYTFYNPTKDTITARLAFPFGSMPDYAPYALGQDASGKWWEKEIIVNEKRVEPVIRLTYCGYNDFNAYNEREKLVDGYVNDSFFKPDLPVTKYTYTFQTDEKDSSNIWSYLEVEIDTTKTKIVTDGTIRQWNEKKKNKEATLELEVWNSQVEFYVLGDTDFEHNFSLKDLESEKNIDRRTTVKTEEMSFENFVLLNLDKKIDGSNWDKYNACVAYLKECEQTEGYITESYVQYLKEELMYWYEYEIVFEPGAVVKNVVTAPIYPSIETAYEPPVYEYMYLLSPAKLWESFGDLEIIIRTPFYMTESSVKGFEKTDEGYRLKKDGLPEQELEFTLSKEESPKMDPDIIRYRTVWFLYLVGMPVFVVGGIAAVIIFMVKKSKKKEQ